MDKHRNSLQPGYRLHWYLIKKILGQGGFGITYLAEDTNLNQLVAIKEFLPVELAIREGDASIQPVSGEHREQFKWGLDRFMSEAQTLAKFKHPNIVRVLAVFPENNTAYMIMEYEHGRGLHEILKEKKTLNEEEINQILLPILDGLEAVHASNFIHRDIKPPNIYVREDGGPVLLDFGSARQSLRAHTQTLTTMVSPGYAPFEQYVSKSNKQGPWTDIYGLGATLYRSVTGIPPSESMDRSESILHTQKDIYVSATEIVQGKYSTQLLSAIDHAMSFKAEDRPQSITEWRKDFSDSSSRSSRRPNTSEAPTVAVTEDTIRVDEKKQADEISKSSLISRTIDKLYRLIKKLLKWGAILLVVLIIIGILTDDKKKQDQVTDKAQPLSQSEEDLINGDQAEVISTDESLIKEITPSEEIKQDKIIQDLLAGAEKNLGELRLTTPAGNNAVEKYNEILDLDHGNAEALNGLDRVVDEYIKLMDHSLLDGDIPSAYNYLNKGSRVNPDHSGIPAARQRIEDAVTKVDHSETAEQTETDTLPVTESDTSFVPQHERQAIKDARDRVIQNPRDKQARRDMQKLGKRIEGKIKEAINNENYDLAEDYIREILKYAPENSKKRGELLELLNKIEIKKMNTLN